MLKALKVVSGGLLFAFVGCGVEGDVDEPLTETRSALEAAGNDYGVAESFHTTGAIDFTNPMFLQLGTNPRSCATCHAPNQGWTMTADANKALFEASDGLAPLFNLVDEGNRPDADISTKDARRATFGPQTIKLAVTRLRATSARRREGRPVHHHRGRGSVRFPRDHQLVPRLPAADPDGERDQVSAC